MVYTVRMWHTGGMITTPQNIARALRGGWSVATFTHPHDGYSAVPVDADGMVRTTVTVAPDDHALGVALEVGGRAYNLLYPSPGICCIHGLVHRTASTPWEYASCPCGQAPLDANPARND